MQQTPFSSSVFENIEQGLFLKPGQLQGQYIKTEKRQNRKSKVEKNKSVAEINFGFSVSHFCNRKLKSVLISVLVGRWPF